MELVKANLHTERNKCHISNQSTLEEDRTISDRNPDAEMILLENAEIIVEEGRPGKDTVLVRGKVIYELMIRSDQGNGMYRLQGEMLFEEKLRAEGAEPTDQIEISAQLEDFRTGLINSRKINIRALLWFEVNVRQLYDEEIPIGVSDTHGLEIKRDMMKQSVLAVEGKDILRIREELELPGNLPAIGEVLWKSLELRKWELHPLEGSIGVQGEVQLFILYEGVGREIKQFHTSIPFSETVECLGSRSTMQAEIRPMINTRNVLVKEDYDGETRILDIEMILDLPIRLLENREWELITDVYSTTEEIVPEYLLGYRKLVREKQQGRIKLSRIFSLSSLSAKVLQVCHIEGRVLPLEIEKKENGLWIGGTIVVSVLCLTESEDKPYEVIRGEAAYSHLLEDELMTENSFWTIVPLLESARGTLLDGESIEVKLSIGLEVLLGERWTQPVLDRLLVQPLSPEKMNALPGMVVYFAEKEESLWDIGKKYMVSLESIHNLNQLETEYLKRGEKVLLVKEGLR